MQSGTQIGKMNILKNERNNLFFLFLFLFFFFFFFYCFSRNNTIVLAPHLPSSLFQEFFFSNYIPFCNKLYEISNSFKRIIMYRNARMH